MYTEQFPTKKYDCGCVEILNEAGRQVDFIPCDDCRQDLLKAGYVEEVLYGA